jgi:hypothetical protein
MLRHRVLPLLASLAVALLTAHPAAATASPGTYLIMPIYHVAPAGFGRTSLWAVRNSTSAPIDLKVQYFGAAQATTPEAEEVFDLAANQTMTRNLRDAVADLGIPVFGWARFIAFEDGDDLSVVPEAIHGDYFLVEPGDAFGGGSELLRDHQSEIALGVPPAPQHDLCHKIETRFFNGGGFTGGTDFALHAHWDPTAGYSNPLAVGAMYDEGGTFLGNCNVNAPPHSAGHFAYTTITNTTVFAVVCPDLPTFGTIEWTFAAGVKGHVTVWHRASGLYSVLVAGACTEE